MKPKEIKTAAGAVIAATVLYLTFRYFYVNHTFAKATDLYNAKWAEIKKNLAAPQTVAVHVAAVQTPQQVRDNTLLQPDVLSNNFLLWSNAIIQQLKDSGNAGIAKKLQVLLLRLLTGKKTYYSAWSYSMPISINKLDGKGYYDQSYPDLSFSDTTDYNNNVILTDGLLYHLCVQIMGLVAKNIIEGNTKGTAVLQREFIVDRAVSDISKNVTPQNIDAVPAWTIPLIRVFNYSVSGAWPLDSGGGGSVDHSDTDKIIGYAIKAASLALVLI